MRRPLLSPQQRRATHPQMAQHMLIRVWVKPSAHLWICSKTEKKPKKRKKKES
jgi:hypothetical protein